MQNLIVTIDKATRKVELNRDFVGLSGENLQGDIVVDFSNSSQFVDGTAFLEVDQNGNKYTIEMGKDSVNKYYLLPIKSSLLSQACTMKFQVVIIQSETESGVPIFKSDIFQVPCKEAINATETIDDQYTVLVETLIAQIGDLNEAVKQNTADIADLKENGGGGGSGGGADGKDGKSAYEIWLELGNTGTEEDFINSLKGEDGASWYTNSQKLPDGPNWGFKAGDMSLIWNGDIYKFNTNNQWVYITNIKGPQGVNGEDGTNGKDGVSPTVSVSKSGKVTTITITDKNGTKTATINDGADGANGKDGVDGKDYILTENDKTEIANEALSILQGGEIPEYWNGAFTDKSGKTYTKYLDEKIARVKALQNEGGKDSFSFIMITDTHYPSNLGKISPLLARKIINDCNIKFALNGGDIQTRGCYQTKAEILSQNKQVAEMFAPIKDKTLQIEGNHDGSYCWSGGAVNSGEPYTKQLTEQEMFEEYYRKNGLNGNVVFDENSNAFYIDDTANKVRYIGLNSMNVPNEPTDINADGTALYPKMHKTQFLQTQYDFLCNEALVTLPSDAWSVVVFGHSGIYNSGDYGVMVDVLSAYKDKTNCVVEYEGTESGGAAYTNLAEPLPNNTTDTSKWVKEHRISSSGITSSSDAGKTVCNFIPCKKGDIVRIKGVAFVDSNDRYQLFKSDKTSFDVQYISSPSASTITSINKVGDMYEITLADNVNTAYIRFAFSTPTNPESVIITVNQPIVEAEHGYDYVSVNKDFTNVKGKFIAYFHGHEHQDKDYTRDSIKDIATRCDAQEEYEEVDRAERVKGTITEQSFDVFTINKAKRKIYATKIGAGVDREIDY